MTKHIWVCICNQMFTTRSRRARHMLKCHEVLARDTCPICGSIGGFHDEDVHIALRILEQYPDALARPVSHLRALFHRHKWVSDPLPDEFIRDGLAAGMPVGAPRACTKCRASSCCGRRHEPS